MELWAKRVLCHFLGCVALMMSLVGASGTLSVMFGLSGSAIVTAMIGSGYPVFVAAFVGGLVLLPGFIIGLPPYRMISGWAWPNRAHLAHVLFTWSPFFLLPTALFYVVALGVATPREALVLLCVAIAVLGFIPCIAVHRWAESAGHREVAERFA